MAWSGDGLRYYPGVMRSLLMFLPGFLLVSCSVLPTAPAPVVMGGIAYHSMQWQVKISALGKGMSAVTLHKGLQRLLDEANAVLSTYQPDTELMRFNRAAVGEWVRVSPMLFHAVETAVQVSALTNGAYDVTAGPLVDLWGFGPTAIPIKIPDEKTIAAARARVGWQNIGLDASQQRLMRKTDIQIDLSSLGEGVAVDALAAYLEQQGIHDYLVSVAGCSRVRGRKPDGTRWIVAIEKPDGSGLPPQRLQLEAQALSTSGSYRNYHEIENRRYSHSINPYSGWPVTHRGVAVTVVTAAGADTLLADALATAFNVLGPAAGYRLAEEKNIAVFYIEKTDTGFREKYSRGFQPYLMR